MKGNDKSNKNRCKGFTLIELVIVMVLAGILSIVVAVFITEPISAYVSVAYRAALVDAADITLQRMARDIRRAVPNSLRVKTVGNQSAVEMINIVEGMRYRATLAGPFLDFNNSVNSFNVIGDFQFALTNPTCAANACRLVVYNTGANNGSSDSPTDGQNVYSTAVVPACSPGPACNPPPGTFTISPVGTSVTLTPGTEGNIATSAGVKFALPSARQRIDIIDTPVTYLCDANVGQQQITRYAGYNITDVQPLVPVGATSIAQLANNVTACSFTYSPGTSSRNGVITMRITLTNAGETITLMRQVGVDNTP